MLAVILLVRSFNFGRKILFDQDFCWQKIIVLRSWKDYCGRICYSGKNLFCSGIWFLLTKNYSAKIRKRFLCTDLLFWDKFVFSRKNWFLLEINTLKSWKDFCWQFSFSVLEKIYFFPIGKIFLFQSKMRQKRVIFYQYFGSISKNFGQRRCQIKSHSAIRYKVKLISQNSNMSKFDTFRL